MCAPISIGNWIAFKWFVSPTPLLHQIDKIREKQKCPFSSLQIVPDIDDISKQLLRVRVVFNGDEWLNVAAAVVAIVLA